MLEKKTFKKCFLNIFFQVLFKTNLGTFEVSFWFFFLELKTKMVG
jgi:hypothetical protein